METYNINQYNNIFYHTRNKSYFKYLFVLFIIGIIYVLFNYKFYMYKSYKIVNDGNNLSIIINIEDEDILSYHKYIYINKNKYAFKIDKINTPYNSYNNILIEELNIKIKNYKQKSKIADAQILVSKKTIVDMINEFIKGG